MPRPSFEKSAPALVETFKAVAPGPPVETRPMFGYPACFVNGNMFMGLFHDDMILRLPDDSREELMKLGGSPFAPMPGRVMREYVVVPAAVISSQGKLSSWVKRALDYGMTLPSKSKSAKAKGGPRKKKSR
jgi:TfoX/Sxy family transcriptional regulator of competence genes